MLSVVAIVFRFKLEDFSIDFITGDVKFAARNYKVLVLLFSEPKLGTLVLKCISLQIHFDKVLKTARKTLQKFDLIAIRIAYVLKYF